MRFPRRKHRVAPVSKDGAAPWFETPRKRLRKSVGSKIAAPHHEAGRGCECIKLIGTALPRRFLRDPRQLVLHPAEQLLPLLR